MRSDLNMPLDFHDEKVVLGDTTRLDTSLNTLRYVLSSGGKLIIMSHLGRPQGEDSRYSLQCMVKEMEKRLSRRVHLLPIGKDSVEASLHMENGAVLLLENLRFYPGEKENAAHFAKLLAQHADVYINDAFGTAHRSHASIVGVPRHVSGGCFMGLLMEKEIYQLGRLLRAEKRGFVGIIGGAKVSDKILWLSSLLSYVDCLIIGGGMAFTFGLAQGLRVGNSLVEESRCAEALALLSEAKRRKISILLPIDVLAGDRISPFAQKKRFAFGDIEEGWMGLDIGEKSLAYFEKYIVNARHILWNGPMGVYEYALFAKGTQAVAQMIVKATRKGAYSVVGGGDSLAALQQLGGKDDISHASTGGGAMLCFLQGKSLEAMEALKKTHAYS